MQGSIPLRRILITLGWVFVLWILLTVAVWFAEPDAFAHDGQEPSFFNAVWFSLVTLTTVGYGDMSPQGATGKVVTILLFFLSVAVFSFMLTNIQAVVTERQRLKALGMNGTKFKGHVVVVSYSRISTVAVKELLAAGRQIAVIVEEAGSIPLVQALGSPDRLFVTVGDPTSEEALHRVNITAANTVVAASEDDTLNLIVALEMKRLNPTARIVVSTKRAELRSTLTSSGVTYVASPFELSGRLVASAAFEPEVAKFVDDVTSGADDSEEDESGYDLQQFTLPPTSSLVNNTVAQVTATLKQIQGPLLVAIAKHVGNGQYDLFPHPSDDVVLYQYDSVIVLGNTVQNNRVSSMLGVMQGR